jgi:UDP-glucuronate decarboxylase
MHPDDGRVVYNFIIQALQNKEITIYGTGNQSRSFCYCDDLIRGLIAMMNTNDDVTGPVNIGNPVEFSIKELAEMVIEIIGSSSKIVYLPQIEDDPMQRQPIIEKAKEKLEWEPTVKLREGLSKTIAYFENELKSL